MRSRMKYSYSALENYTTKTNKKLWPMLQGTHLYLDIYCYVCKTYPKDPALDTLNDLTRHMTESQLRLKAVTDDMIEQFVPFVIKRGARLERFGH